MSDLPTTPSSPDNVVPLKPPEAVITDLASFEAEVVRRLEEEGYEDVANPVAYGQQDKVYREGATIEKGVAYPGIPGSIVAAIFSTAQGKSYLAGDIRIFIAPKSFGDADKYLIITVNRRSVVLSMRAALDRTGFVEAVVDEWAFCFDGDEDTDSGCFAEDCDNEPVFVCMCQSCEGKVYQCCMNHRHEADRDHLDVQGRPPKWEKVASSDLPS